MKDYTKCPWLKSRGHCNLNNDSLLCLKEKCPIVRLFDHYHIQEARSNNLWQKVDVLEERIDKQQKEIDELKKRIEGCYRPTPDLC